MSTRTKTFLVILCFGGIRKRLQVWIEVSNSNLNLRDACHNGFIKKASEPLDSVAYN